LLVTAAQSIRFDAIGGPLGYFLCDTLFRRTKRPLFRLRGGPPVIVALGEALVAALPTRSVAIEDAPTLELAVGGAELNFAVGVRRLGLPAAWVGCVGDDPLGRIVLRCLEAEGVDRQWIRVDPQRPTGLYLREWLPDGVRRPYYYRRESAALGLGPAMWPSEALTDVSWLHLTGITVALGSNPRRAVEHAVAWANDRGVRISFDPNYRPWLWSGAGARKDLGRLAALSDVLLMSEEDAELLYGTRDPERALQRAHATGVEVAVMKLGDQGAIASDGSGVQASAPSSAAAVVDPVGAGDGFNAGFVVGMLSSQDLGHALALGNHVGARAVERVGEHTYPFLDELPPELRRVLGGAPRLARDPEPPVRRVAAQ
jgi:2-dehydro-3-deoxygluconokinase